jgi:RNA polymerase sigma-70 factor (ECF subfamily)
MAITAQQVRDEFDAGLRSFIRGRVRDPDSAEDILQDVYLKIHSRADTLRSEERVRSWVFQIARNSVHDYYRTLRSTEQLVGELPYIPEDPSEDEVSRTLAESVRCMLDRLPPQSRQALVLTEYQGLTQAQLAEQLRISLSGAKSRVQRARARLKALLLACCHFELDGAGRVVNYEPRRGCCSTTGGAIERSGCLVR